MENKILALKYRPQIFDDLIGQDVVVETIKNSISSGKIPNAFLFTGIRGIGKTTIARVLAKSLNCSKDSNTNYRQDARDFFGGEEYLVDALVLYYGGTYNHYRTSGNLNSDEQTYLTDYINTCSA